MTLYFAYGSNMLTARLVARCGSAQVLGSATLDGHGIAFDKIGRDNSGKATLVPDRPGRVHGVLYRLDDAELQILDAIEGVGSGYDRVVVRPDASSGGVTAMAYIAPAAFRDASMQPFDWYMALVLAGARQHGLPSDWVARLSRVPSMADDDADRPRRREALSILMDCLPAWLPPGFS